MILHQPFRSDHVRPPSGDNDGDGRIGLTRVLNKVHAIERPWHVVVADQRAEATGMLTQQFDCSGHMLSLTNMDADGRLRAQDDRRLSDLIAKAFYQACGQKNALAANYLLRALEAVYSFEANLGIENRRVVVDLISEMRRELLTTTSPVEPPVIQP